MARESPRRKVRGVDLAEIRVPCWGTPSGRRGHHRCAPRRSPAERSSARSPERPRWKPGGTRSARCVVYTGCRAHTVTGARCRRPEEGMAMTLPIRTRQARRGTPRPHNRSRRGPPLPAAPRAAARRCLTSSLGRSRGRARTGPSGALRRVYSVEQAPGGFFHRGSGASAPSLLLTRARKCCTLRL